MKLVTCLSPSQARPSYRRSTVAPSVQCVDETLSTLDYANRAKNIKNKPKINEDPKDALLREYQDEIAKLKEQLALLNQGGDMSELYR